MYGFKKFFGSFALVAVLSIGGAGLSGCESWRQSAADVAVSSTTTSPAQAKSLGDAILITTQAEKTLDIYVTSGLASPAVLAQLKILVPAVHNALKKAEDAQRAGDSPLVAASLAAFNEALTALNSYKATKGIK